MPTRGLIAKLFWLTATAAAFAVCALWVVGGSLAGGGLWALPLLAPSIALVLATARSFSHRSDARTRYERRHKPLAGPRPGAWLPH